MPFNCFLDQFIKHPEEVVAKEIFKLQPLNYNQFMWWRSHTDNVKPLGKRFPLKDRILNGDFNFSSYYWQAQLAAINAKTKLDLDKDDYQMQYEKTQLDVARYRRLVADYEKEESTRLKELVDAFTKAYKITEEGLLDKLSEWTGDILSFYEHMEEFAYKLPAEVRKNKRGRPKKLGTTK